MTDEVTPAYYILEINLGIANGVMNRDEQAQGHFLRAIALAPGDAIPYYFYARWLLQKGNIDGARAQLQHAIAANPDYHQAHVLMDEVISRAKPTPNCEPAP